MISAEESLQEAISEYSSGVAALAGALISTSRERLPGANLLVYDGYNALAVAFSANEKQNGIVFSITLYPRWVSLFFPGGAELNDPEGLLKGSGKTIRHVVIEDERQFDADGVRNLVDQALNSADPPISEGAVGEIIIKSVASKKRLRRPR